MTVSTQTRSSATGLGAPQRRRTPAARWHRLADAARTAWSFDHPVLTTEGRRLLERRADELRTVALPALQTAVNDPNCDGHTYAVYAHAYYELRQLDATLGEARGMSTLRCDRSLVELGDLVTLEFLDTEPSHAANASDAGGSVRRFLLVHPVEGALDDLRVSAASPLARAVLGRVIGNVVQVAAPAGSYPVRILAAKRPGGNTGGVVSWASPTEVRPGAAPSWPRTAARQLYLDTSASAPRG